MSARHYIGFSVPDEMAASVRAAFPEDEQQALTDAGLVDDWTPADALHCTLMFLGEVSSTRGVRDELEELVHGQLPVSLRLRGETTLLNSHLVVPVDGADAMAERVIARLGHVSQDPGVLARPYFGHVTIARCHDTAAGERLIGRMVRHEWVVDSVDLVRSNGSTASPRYSVASTHPFA
ncbi:2'-5' RNA ligase family protein [Microbacterium forte]|uniref:2'-5' RNA ligase family protein n=1 Tax=Microbacterium forte TaxID=2982533 RepID=UPI0035D9FE34